MSLETREWLHNNVKVGFTAKRGAAWWAYDGINSVDDFGNRNHYPRAIPLNDIFTDLPAFRTPVISAPLQVVYEDPDNTGQFITHTDASRQVILRPDNKAVYGVFGDRYVIHQYKEWLIGLASDLLDTSTSDLGIANVVTLRNGAQAAVQFELPENVTTGEGLVLRPSLLIVSSLDGSLATEAKMVVTNVVCDNTMRAAFSEKGASAKAKHTLNSLNKLDAMRVKLGIEFVAEEITEEFDKLMQTPVPGPVFKLFLEEYRKDKHGNDPLSPDAEDGRARTMAELRQDQLLNLWITDERVAPYRGTAFGVLQLTNTYLHHVAPTNKGTVRYERNMANAITGKTERSDAKTLKVLEKVLVMAE